MCKLADERNVKIEQGELTSVVRILRSCGYIVRFSDKRVEIFRPAPRLALTDRSAE